MRITLAQIAPKLNRSNLANTLKIINEIKQSSDLIVFPELSLNGYMLQDKLYEDAYSLEELNVLKELSKEIDIVVGAAISDKSDEYKNSALYFSQGEIVTKHDKVHLPNYGMFEEARYFSAGDSFSSFYVKDIKISMAVCEDLWHQSTIDKLSKMSVDLVIVLAASPARGFNDDGLEIEDKWYEILRTCAKECNAKVIFVNRVGFEDGLGFWGGSCIVDENQTDIAKLPRYKSIIKTFKI